MGVPVRGSPFAGSALPGPPVPTGEKEEALRDERPRPR